MSFKKIEYLYDISNSSDIWQSIMDETIGFSGETLGQFIRGWLRLGNVDAIYSGYTVHRELHFNLLSSISEMEDQIKRLEMAICVNVKALQESYNRTRRYEADVDKCLTSASKIPDADASRTALKDAIRLNFLEQGSRSNEWKLVADLEAQEETMFKYRDIVNGYRDVLKGTELIVAAFRSYLSVHAPDRLASEE
jgi:hypothetical protein